MTEERQPVVVVGHAARDLVDDDPRGWRLGGSVTYVSYAIARLGIPVRAVIGVDPEASRSAELDVLADAGVDLHRIGLESGPVFRNVETPHGRRQQCLSTGPALAPSDVPAAWRTARAWAFVPVLGEVEGGAWARLPAQGALVVLGWQGMLRAAEAGGPTVKRAPYADPVVARADIVVVGTDDLSNADPAAAAGRWERSDAADAFAALFPRPGQQLALTAGERGGRLFVRRATGWVSQRYDAAIARVVDWTGAGDVFLAAYLAAVADPSLAGGSVAERLAFAALVAAMSIEGPGITTTPTRAEALARLTSIAG